MRTLREIVPAVEPPTLVTARPIPPPTPVPVVVPPIVEVTPTPIGPAVPFTPASASGANATQNEEEPATPSPATVPANGGTQLAQLGGGGAAGLGLVAVLAFLVLGDR